jgi:hypothetical protein
MIAFQIRELLGDVWRAIGILLPFGIGVWSEFSSSFEPLSQFRFERTTKEDLVDYFLSL